MRQKVSAYFLVGLIGLYACTEKEDYTIYGEIQNMPKELTIQLYQLNPRQVEFVDSVTTHEGRFGFTVEINEPSFYRLQLPDQSIINLILKPGEKISIKADYRTFQDNYEVNGSTESIILQQYNTLVKQNFIQRENLGNEYQQNIYHPQIDSLIKVYGQRYDSLIRELEEATVRLIDSMPFSFVALSAVEQLDEDKYYSYYLKVDSAFSIHYPQSKYFIPFHERVVKMKRLAPGVEAPDIVLPDINGNTRRLSSLRGKYVMIDFWASWCKPCRNENPNVVRLYKKYNSKGFEVFSVSLDGLPQQQNPKELWIQAIKEDGLIWPNHVSDLSGWNSPVVAQYEVMGIPFTVLIDKEGRIIGKNLRGEVLENKLKEIFGE